MHRETRQALSRIDTIMELGMQTSVNSSEEHLKNISMRYQEKAKQIYDKLASCLENSLQNLFINPFSSSSMSIKLENHSSGECIIDITPYGRIIAMYIYGSIPQQIIASIHRCLQDCELIRLTEDEIEELRTSGRYYHLF